MAKKPLYIQLEPGAYPKDIEWQMMSAEERGCYHSLIIFIACNNGSLPNNPNSLAILCNISVDKMKTFLEKHSHKFVISSEEISHKRVSGELARARKSIRQKSLAGKKGMQRRYNTVTTPTPNTDITKVSKVKVREVKVSEDTNKDAFDKARKLFKGRKNGLEPEYKNFQKRHKNFKDIIPLLTPAIESQITWRREDGCYWKNFQTWINNSCWTEEKENYERNNRQTANPNNRKSQEETEPFKSAYGVSLANT